ncbi:MAG: hypothetical protein K5641_06820 [Lachnospiraceae bacterium]|nr:hypothetical protein [Lachnospiraceae bacterium]
MAYKYVGVSVRNSFANVDGVFFVLLIVLFHVTTGRAGYVTRLFEPAVMIGLILTVGAAIIYPHIRDRRDTEGGRPAPVSAKTPKKILIIGIAVAIIAAFFDGAESMVTSVLLGDDVVDSVDYICATGTLQVVISILLWIWLWIRNKEIYTPFRKTEKKAPAEADAINCFSNALYYCFLPKDTWRCIRYISKFVGHTVLIWTYVISPVLIIIHIFTLAVH